LSRQIALEEDPEGLPDFTLPVAIVAELIPSLAVDIAAQSIGNLKIDIASQSLAQLNVAIVASTATIDVNIKSQTATLNVNIASQSVTLNVNVTNSTLNVTVSGTVNVNVTNSTLNVNIAGSTTDIGVVIKDQRVSLNVYITGCYTTLNVNIASQSTTIDVNISSASATLNVNITAQSVVLNINIADYKPTITPTTMIEKGTQVVATAGGFGGTEIVYECPENKTAYLLTISYFAFCMAIHSYGEFMIFAYIDGTIHPLVHGILDLGDRMWDVVSGGIIKLKPGDQLGFSTDYNTYTHVTFIVIEV